MGNQVGPIGGINVAGYANLAALRVAFGAANNLQLSMLRFGPGGGLGSTNGAHMYLRDYIDLLIDANLAHGTNGPRTGGGEPATGYTISIGDFYQ